MERSGFFDAKKVGEGYDRVYLSAQFASYFASFLGNGIFAGKLDGLQVISAEPQSMNVVVRGGQGYINGYWYENTDGLIIPIAVADGVLNRIDRIVLRWDASDRSITLKKKSSALSQTPVAPVLQRDADIYELGLADVLVSRGTINISQSMITDQRLNDSLCGVVSGLIDQIDVTALDAQFKSKLDELVDAFDISSQGLYDSFRTEIQRLIEQLQGLLEGDVALNLQNQINSKLSKIDPAVPDNLPKLNGDGSLSDSGVGINSVMKKVVSPVSQNIAKIQADGSIENSGISVENVVTKQIAAQAKPDYSSIIIGRSSWEGSIPPFVANLSLPGVIVGDTQVAIASSDPDQRSAWSEADIVLLDAIESDKIRFQCQQKPQGDITARVLLMEVR